MAWQHLAALQYHTTLRRAEAYALIHRRLTQACDGTWEGYDRSVSGLRVRFSGDMEDERLLVYGPYGLKHLPLRTACWLTGDEHSAQIDLRVSIPLSQWRRWPLWLLFGLLALISVTIGALFGGLPPIYALAICALAYGGLLIPMIAVSGMRLAEIIALVIDGQRPTAAIWR